MGANKRKSIILRAINVWRRALTHNPKDFWTEKGGGNYFIKYPPGGSRNENLILKVLENEKFDSLIDIGCGYGRYLKTISERFPKAKLVGVEISPTQLEKAKDYLKHCKNIQLEEINGVNIPYRDKFFDISLTYGCMLYVTNNTIRLFIKELQRISQRGIFIESNRIRTTIQDYLSPGIWRFSHNYEKLFKKFSYEVVWSHQTEGLIESLFYVDFDSK